jgi:hypothetical protein
LHFIMAISSLPVTPALLRVLKSALASRKMKKAVVAGSRGTARGGGPKASSQFAGKRKANELLSAGESIEAANRRPAPDTGSAILHAFLSVTGEQAAIGSRHLGPSEGGTTYAAVLAEDVTPLQRSGLLKTTATDSEPSDSAVSIETANMSGDISGPLIGKPDGTTPNSHVAKTCLPAGQRPNKTPICISGYSDVRAFLAWLWESCPGGLTARLKGETLLVVPSRGRFQGCDP